MEDEDIIYDDYFKNSPDSNLPNIPNARNYGSNSDLGSSEYDKGLDPTADINFDDYGNSLSSNRAHAQPTSHKVGNAAIRLLNILPEAVGSIASALDVEDYWNQDDEFGNWLTDWTESIKKNVNEYAPIHRENPRKAFDIYDPGYWIENGSSLVNSIGGFAIGGVAIVKGLSLVSKLAKTKQIGTAISKYTNAARMSYKNGALTEGVANLDMVGRAGDIIHTGLTALGQNQGAAVLGGTQVYHEIYQSELAKLNKEFDKEGTNFEKQLEVNKAAARQKAADAASDTALATRLTIPLNLMSASMFIKSPMLSRVKHKKASFGKTVKTGTLEGFQESGEEVIEHVAGKYGRARGHDKEYGFKEIMNDIGSIEAAEAAMLGFIGGMGQTVITKEGVNRLKTTIDPDTGEKISVRKYNDKAYVDQQAEIAKHEEIGKALNVKTVTDAYHDYEDMSKMFKAYEEADAAGDAEEVARLKSLGLNQQAYSAFKTGSTDSLIRLYEEMRDGEQKEGMPDDYKERSTKAIEKIKALETHYNATAKYVNHQQVYHNKAYREDLINHNNDLANEISKVNIELNKVTTLLTGGTIFDDSKKGKNGEPNNFFFDVNNIGFNPALHGGAEGHEMHGVIKELVENSPEYQTRKVLLKSQEKLKENIIDNMKKYSEMTSNDYQESFGKALENIKRVLKKRLIKKL